MDIQVLVKRKAITMTFSREFESLLLRSKSDHISLTHDLEFQALIGLKILEELEDVHDLKHVDTIQKLLLQTNLYTVIDSTQFPHWHINVSEDLLDEVDLLLLTHGEDLKQLGLKNVSQGTVLVMLAVAAIKNVDLTK